MDALWPGRLVGQDDRPRVALDDRVSEEGFGRVGLDPRAGQWLSLLLDVEHPGQVEASVAVDGASRFHLQGDAVRAEPSRRQALRQSGS